MLRLGQVVNQIPNRSEPKLPRFVTSGRLHLLDLKRCFGFLGVVVAAQVAATP